MFVRRRQRAIVTQLAALGSFVLIVGLNADAQPPAVEKPAVKAPHDYLPGDLLLERCRVYIRVDKTGLGHVHGVAGLIKEGRMPFAAQGEPGRLVFDMPSFVADAAYARRYLGIEGETSPSTQREVTETMLGADVLDAQRFPTAVFQIESLQSTGQSTKQGVPLYRVDGEFTLHGVKRPLAFVVQAEPHGDWLHVRGTFAMRQSDFGIEPLTKAFGAIGVQDELHVWGDLWVAARPTRQ